MVTKLTVISVLAALAQTAISQSFILVYADNRTQQAPLSLTESEENSDVTSTSNISSIVIADEAITLNTSSDLSQSTMDIITVVWYIATFLALSAFFLLMACSDRRRGGEPIITTGLTTENSLPTITPTPSYTQFAPPSYETVMKMQNSSSIFVIPLSTSPYQKDAQGSVVNPSVQNFNFYIVHEVEK